MILTGQESNYHVLEEALKWLKDGGDIPILIQSLNDFLQPKRRVATRIQELTKRARRGDHRAAREIISELAAMNDGP